MGDIYLGIAIMMLLAVGLFALGLWAGRRVSRRVFRGMAVAGVAGVLLHAFWLLEHPGLAWLLPFSNLVVVGNWSPLFVGLLAGLAWACRPVGAAASGDGGNAFPAARGPGRSPGSVAAMRQRPAWRKLLLVGVLVAVCLWRAYGRLLGEPPPCGDFWVNGVCVQTSQASCSAACATTLLKAHGIEATEAELAVLCLTRKWGTTRHGVYRGLKIKTAGTPYRVEVFHWDLDELRRKPPGPVLLHVRLDRGTTDDPRYVRDWGWTPGVGHAVVLFGFLGDGLVEMGDPGVGREKWRVDHLKVLWHGWGMRLVRRSRRGTSAFGPQIS